jgi:isocitrate/isopropylmalate dehydrogenase
MAVSGGTAITVAYGDGIGPEIMRAALHVLHAGGARLDIEEIEIGEQVYRRFHLRHRAWRMGQPAPHKGVL